MNNEIEVEARRQALNAAQAVVDALAEVNEAARVDDLDEGTVAALNQVWGKAQAAVEFASARLAASDERICVNP
jgi:hypothetical protein